MALLQRLMTAPTLESYVVKGRAAVVRWAKTRFGFFSEADAETIPSSNSLESGQPSGQPEDITVHNAAESSGEHRGFEEDWWCVKAAGGNGGMDVWVLHAGNWRSVAEKLQEGEDYVIQVGVTSDSNSRGGQTWNMHRSLCPCPFTKYLRRV